MTTQFGDDPEGATPLEPEDLEDLIPVWVTTRNDLNIAEFEGIARSLPWAIARAKARGVSRLLSIEFLFELHRKMFSDVWRWAGKQRTRQTNIGVDPARISTDLRNAFDDARFWHDNGTYEPVEIAVRTHHRLVLIHPFRNGNGRCTRMIADLYLLSSTGSGLSWGSNNDLVSKSDERSRYLECLRSADRGDYASLIDFATS